MLEKVIQRVMRMVQGVFKNDTSVFKEIEHDENANPEAALVVVVAAVLSAIGTAIATRGHAGSILFYLIGGVVLNWLLWSYIIVLVGKQVYKAEASFWEVARVVGYANAPMALGLLKVLGCLGGLIGAAAGILSLILGFFAVREALDLTTEKTIVTIIIGWVVIFVINMILVAMRIII